jgi:hypothetical protein
VYRTTGLSGVQFRDIGGRIEAASIEAGKELWPPILGFHRSLMVALTYLRRNRVQAEIAEAYGVSQSTISRAITVLTPLIAAAVDEFIPTAEELDPQRQYIVDGTLLPCWSWRSRRSLFSGKHKTTGLGVQVACTLEGALAWISDPIDGSRHDSFALQDSQALITLDPANWIGDKGYVGNDMITPYKKPQGGELTDWQKEFNSQVNKTRWIVEQVIANFKTWRILHTDYRRPLKTFTETISCVIGLHFYRMASE